METLGIVLMALAAGYLVFGLGYIIYGCLTARKYPRDDEDS